MVQEPSYGIGDHLAILLQRKMPGIEQMELKILQVPLVGVRSFCGEDVVILAPDDQGRWLVFAKVGLPCRIVRYIALVVVEKSKLDFRIGSGRYFTSTRQ